MEILNRIMFGILILHLYVNAAPNDVRKIEDIAKLTEGSQPLDSGQLNQNQSNENSTGSTREKRWYNPYEFGFPPINPVIYPNINKRQDSFGYGYEDPLEQIHRRVQEIAGFVRQPPPPIPNFPYFFPVIFVPPADCFCNNPTTTSPPPPQPTPNTPTGPTPTVTERWPEMDDERQNWGLVDNETESDEDGEDFSRPISFDPIKPIGSVRPPPPVDHGSVQSDAQNPMAPSEQPLLSASSRPPSPPPPANNINTIPPMMPPSPCDSAILTCCHRPVVTYECFAVQGCPDFKSLGNPCAPNTILRVIDLFQRFYGQKSR